MVQNLGIIFSRILSSMLLQLRVCQREALGETDGRGRKSQFFPAHAVAARCMNSLAMSWRLPNKYSRSTYLP